MWIQGTLISARIPPLPRTLSMPFIHWNRIVYMRGEAKNLSCRINVTYMMFLLNTLTSRGFL